jgi:pseudouridine-5'-phosphate glycosidase
VEEPIRVSQEVRDALAAGRGVVALETSVLAQGLPWPDNMEAARRCLAAVRSCGSVPAPVALLGGRAVVGASLEELGRLSDPAARPAKAGARDLAPLLRAGRDAGTTVSATCALAARVGIRLFATGGIGGVHRRVPEDRSPASDVSADLPELARQPVCVVASGPKAVLDVAATAEALETLGIPVVGWRTSELPAFYGGASGISLEHRVEDATEAAALLRMHWAALRRPGGVLLCVAPPAPLPRAAVEGAVSAGVAEARRRRLGGKELTPFLLEAVARVTGGASRAANLALLEHNAGVAGEVAAALARTD